MPVHPPGRSPGGRRLGVMHLRMVPLPVVTGVHEVPGLCIRFAATIDSPLPIQSQDHRNTST